MGKFPTGIRWGKRRIGTPALVLILSIIFIAVGFSTGYFEEKQLTITPNGVEVFHEQARTALGLKAEDINVGGGNPEELCGNGIDFVHRDDIIELKTIIVEPDFISLYFHSLKSFLLNKKPSAISSSWRLIHFNEAIQDREILPLIYIDPEKIDSSTIAKLLLLIN